MEAAIARASALPSVVIRRNVPLAEYTRFNIGGPATALIETGEEGAFRKLLLLLAGQDVPRVVIGGGTNLIVSDSGFDGIVLRFTGEAIEVADHEIRVQAGAVLQNVIDASIAASLQGLHTMTGIPGWLGGAVYGNAGAYGHSIQESVVAVYATDGLSVREFSLLDCEFAYRESWFKAQKQWVILSAVLELTRGDGAKLQEEAASIRKIRAAKYPPDMKCAGSIFKNLLFAQLPLAVQQIVPSKLVREGKVPSAWFLEEAGVKGLRKGDIQVAAYHANLIYNDGRGTAADLVTLIEEVKHRVWERFGFRLEEEVQRIGFAF